MTIASILLMVLGADPQMCVEEEEYSLDAVFCDDGVPLVDPSGQVNYECRLNGCSMYEETCWGYRLDHCYDDGFPNGQCALAEITCTSSIGCLGLWAICAGTLDCANGGVKSGWCVCTEEE